VRENQRDGTTSGINGFSEAQLPEKFGSGEYHILIVAEKYQTGFDQPLLHTMFVDKRLKGLRAVQTLSRLNRMCPGKEDTFVLDFENEAEEIKEAFSPYYERPEIDEPTDPNQLYTLKTSLEGYQYFWKQEMAEFATVFFRPRAAMKPSDQGMLHKVLDPAVGRFTAEPDEDRREQFRGLLLSYIRLYGFVSQIAQFGDPDLEKLYAFARLLRTKLPKREGGSLIDLDNDVTLTYYRMDKTFEGPVSLPVGEQQFLGGPSDVGTGKPPEDNLSPLSAVIDAINKRFGTDFAEGDRLLMVQALDDLSNNSALGTQARTNTLYNFRHAFEPAAIDAILIRNQRNGEITEQFLGNPELRRMMVDAMALDYYQRARRPPTIGLAVPDQVSLFPEHAVVSLRTSIDADGQVLPEGARGTIVGIYRGGAAYEVEFFEPFHCLATLKPEMLAA